VDLTAVYVSDKITQDRLLSKPHYVI